jgi:hypothetical protein
MTSQPDYDATKGTALAALTVLHCLLCTLKERGILSKRELNDLVLDTALTMWKATPI